jgi:hypothetical protein
LKIVADLPEALTLISTTISESVAKEMISLVNTSLSASVERLSHICSSSSGTGTSNGCRELFGAIEPVVSRLTDALRCYVGWGSASYLELVITYSSAGDGGIENIRKHSRSCLDLIFTQDFVVSTASLSFYFAAMAQLALVELSTTGTDAAIVANLITILGLSVDIVELVIEIHSLFLQHRHSTLRLLSELSQDESLKVLSEIGIIVLATSYLWKWYLTIETIRYPHRTVTEDVHNKLASLPLYLCESTAVISDLHVVSPSSLFVKYI